MKSFLISLFILFSSPLTLAEEISIISVIQNGDIDNLQKFIDSGGDVNARYVIGQTLLHWAAFLEQPETAELLIEHEIDIHATDLFGNTPLHYAAQKGKTQTTEVLLKNEADPNVKNKNGWTPLHLAVHGGFEEATYVLLTHGADINIRTGNNQKTALDIAREYDRFGLYLSLRSLLIRQSKNNTRQ